MALEHSPEVVGHEPAGAQLIPRRIIQTGPSNLPLILEAALVNVHLLHPTYEYMYFNDAMVDAFIEEQLPEHRAAYRSFPYPIQKYDFFRYLAVYRYGGFYLDLDMFLARNLTPLLSSESVWTFEELTVIRYLWSQFNMDWQIGNYAFGSIPSHPFLAAVIDNCLRAQVDAAWVQPMMKSIPSPFRKQFYVLNTTGPGLVSRTCAENPHLANRLSVLFPDDVRDPRTWHQFGPFGVHHMLGSWRDKQNLLSLRLTRLWEGWTLRRVLARGAPLGKTRRYGLAADKDLRIAHSPRTGIHCE